MPTLEFSNITKFVYITNKGNDRGRQRMAQFSAKRLSGQPLTPTTIHNNPDVTFTALSTEAARILYIGDVNHNGETKAAENLLARLSEDMHACAILMAADEATVAAAEVAYEQAGLSKRVVCCVVSQLGMTCSRLAAPKAMKAARASTHQSPSPSIGGGGKAPERTWRLPRLSAQAALSPTRTLKERPRRSLDISSVFAEARQRSLRSTKTENQLLEDNQSQGTLRRTSSDPNIISC